MRRTFLLLAIAVVCVGAATQSTSTQSPAPASSSAQAAVAAPTVANVAVPELTEAEQAALARHRAPARLAAARAQAALLAQRAVHDRDEQSFREPTAAEAAALAVPDSGTTSQEIAVPGGGFAVKTDASGVSLAVATVGKDGVVTGHDTKGGRRDR